jgi:hypothetical protein
MSGVDIVLGDYGIYIPQRFAKILQDVKSWEGYDPKDVEILLQGPTIDGYWLTWENILDNACYVDPKGFRWQLHQDREPALFIYCLELMTDEEYSNFFGTEREND